MLPRKSRNWALFSPVLDRETSTKRALVPLTSDEQKKEGIPLLLENALVHYLYLWQSLQMVVLSPFRKGI